MCFHVYRRYNLQLLAGRHARTCEPAPIPGHLVQVTVELEALTKQYPFQIPSYFALILRCFSVIEGIALRVDPTYSIVQECFPYLARRLLTDDHPRTRAALRQLLYGVGGGPHLPDCALQAVWLYATHAG